MSTTHLSGPLALGGDSVFTATAAKTLVANDNGLTVMLNNATGVTITLPVHKAGLRFKFITGATFATTSFIIIANAADLDTLEGSLIVAGAAVTVASADQLNFIAAAENVGDFVELFSDGTTWHVFGNALTAGGITATG